MIIAVDGPAGAGKSTVSKILAKELGFLYIDTGAIYRAITLKAIKEKIGIKDTDRLIALVNNTHIDLANNQDSSLKVLLDGKDVTQEIRQPEISALVSDIAKIKQIREVTLSLQRRLGRQGNSVLDGRDIGTVVFPDADKKFYIDAAFKVRIERRYRELMELGQDVSLKDVEDDLRNRDTLDSTRKCAPLKKSEDAIYIDTTDMTIEEVVDRMLGYIK